MRLAYCDKIADVIRKALVKYDEDNILNGPVGRIEWDLHPTEGYFLSPKKLIKLWDSNGKAYTVTIEEAPMLDLDEQKKSEKEVDTL